MYFSEYFDVDPQILLDYGALDISLVCDLPLFIDPMLIFNSDKPHYKIIHEEIIKYFHFLYVKAQSILDINEIKAWFKFSEVKNNWVGYSLSGNGGLALGDQYAEYLYNNIGFAVENNGISQSLHIEKIMLLSKGSGKDKISDLTVNLIKGYLLEYTQAFAEKNIHNGLKKRFFVEKAHFNYETESFVSAEYTLPFITNRKGIAEYVLLTPLDILREGEPSINRDDYLSEYNRIRDAIDNDVLRAYVNNYISEAVRRYQEHQRLNKHAINEKRVLKIERDAFLELTREHPELYDYYIRLRESDTNEIRASSAGELNSQLIKFGDNVKSFVKAVHDLGYRIDESLSAKEEAVQRLLFLSMSLKTAICTRTFTTKETVFPVKMISVGCSV